VSLSFSLSQVLAEQSPTAATEFFVVTFQASPSSGIFWFDLRRVLRFPAAFHVHISHPTSFASDAPHKRDDSKRTLSLSLLHLPLGYYQWKLVFTFGMASGHQINECKRRETAVAVMSNFSLLTVRRASFFANQRREMNVHIIWKCALLARGLGR
jgi:hypothetical protein